MEIRKFDFEDYARRLQKIINDDPVARSRIGWLQIAAEDVVAAARIAIATMTQHGRDEKESEDLVVAKFVGCAISLAAAFARKKGDAFDPDQFGAQCAVVGKILLPLFDECDARAAAEGTTENRSKIPS